MGGQHPKMNWSQQDWVHCENMEKHKLLGVNVMKSKYVEYMAQDDELNV